MNKNIERRTVTDGLFPETLLSKDHFSPYRISNKEKNMIIYKITNKINGKIYIGQTYHYNSNNEFLKSNYWGSGKVIQRAIKKYGFENFEKKVLIKNIKTKNELNRYEKIWIKKLKSKTNYGNYNIIEGGRGTKGYKFTKEQKEHQSKVIKKLYTNPDFRKMQRDKTIGEKNGMYGKKHKSSSKELMSESNPKIWLNKNLPQEMKQKISKALLNKKRSKEHSKNISIALQGRKLSEEHKKSISKGLSISDKKKQSKDKTSKTIKEKWKDPKYREKTLNNRKKIHQSEKWLNKMTNINREINSRPEVKAKHSESSKKNWQDPNFRRKIRITKLTNQIKKLTIALNNSNLYKGGFNK